MKSQQTIKNCLEKKSTFRKKNPAISAPNNKSILVNSLLPPVYLWTNISQQTNTEIRKKKGRKKEERKSF